MDKGQNRSQSPFIKNHYYPGKLLHASDFIREQEYGNSKLEFINRQFHGCGIIEGMEVQTKKDGALHITAGSAIDPSGRILVVPENVDIRPEELEGIQERAGQDFILGIKYAEKTSEQERSFLSREEPYRTARVEETFVLKAYSEYEWEQLKESIGKAEGALTEEKILFRSEEVKLTLQAPRVVPADSIFRCRLHVQVLRGNNINIGWRGVMKLQGAYFTASGRPFQVLDETSAEISGGFCREWELCTEEARKLPITLELGNLEILLGGTGAQKAETCQLYIETTGFYEEAARKYLCEDTHNLRESEGTAGKRGQTEDWLPLTHLRSVGTESTGKRYVVSEDHHVRLTAVHPRETELIRRAAEENGILDIRWRGLMRKMRQESGSQYEVRPQPETVPRQDLPQAEPGTQPLQHIHRGVAIVSVPKRYRKGRVLLSEEISHGFPGEEVFLWCGRVYEEPNYAYWEHRETQYSVLQGAEGLFPDSWDSGWEIEKQAVRQDVDEGTFQIALTLSKGRRRRRCREVAISWIAFRII